ncbi:MAG TPA: pyridoxal-dependent decarboxylase [Gaiellales bacterium]|nr:pyridoxal-dependent decarboxylase [Gaiellales bacterium]
MARHIVDPTSMHRYTDETERVARAALDYARDRLRLHPVPLDGPKTADELSELAGATITEDGLGGEAAMRLFADVLAPAIISIDNPRFLAFIPAAPTELSMMFDLVVGASSIYAGTWMEASGAVYAENQALEWLAGLAGLPESAAGCFVQGGTIGNLSALVAARHTHRKRHGTDGARLRVAYTDETHSSVATAAAVMDVDLLVVPADARGRMTGAALAAAIEREGPAGLFAVVATSGTTNVGAIDDLAGIAEVCRAHGLWMHVDGAYGGAALAASSVRDRFAGIEHADSFIVDPHKWLFAPFDSCALIYRNPDLARAAHTQQAGYLEHVQGSELNPSDYAVHLSRRARGLPFWFSLAAHGTRAYSEAIELTLEVAREAADEIRERPYVELLNEPELTVLVVRRTGWQAADYTAWTERLLGEGIAFVTPTVFAGETVTRFAIVNPRTTRADIAAILDTMA